MNDKTVEDLEFHRSTVESGGNSPLHLIREKEIEISGQMLAAKRRADEIVAEARKRGASIVGSAHDEGVALAKKQEVETRAQIEREIEEVDAQAERDATALEEGIAQRKTQAVTFVVESVVGA